ncbi:TetR/AcrR family transcriptional regulator [Streptomyces sp. NPDC006422]|uniref:TetR/AcrR family transcriptional regulator n=1 Tax=unclassified Streptomyces TaxID=2593676 RepID=UPI0033BEB62C
MTPPDAPRSRTGRPPATSRSEIITATRRVIERDGWEKLTVRRLAAELGIGATTLYRHVQDREDLLVHLLNHHAEQAPPLELPEDPRERVVAAATAIHDFLKAWPWAAEVLTTDGFLARLGEPALGMVEAVVAGAEDSGCTQEEAVHVFRSIWYYTVGEILVRSRSARPDSDRDRPLHGTPDFTGFDADRLPRLAAINEQWPALSARDTFPEGLRAFVDGLLGPPTHGA